MKAEKSIEIIEKMLVESQASLIKNSFFFILWGILMSIAGLIEFFTFNQSMYWLVWPIAGTVGGIISAVYGSRENKRTQIIHYGDKMMKYVWGGFVLALVLSVFFSVYHRISPAPIIMILAAYATFISGGISKLNALIYGSFALAIGAVLSGFLISTEYHGLVFAIAILLGYVYPGIVLNRRENG